MKNKKFSRVKAKMMLDRTIEIGAENTVYSKLAKESQKRPAELLTPESLNKLFNDVVNCSDKPTC